MTRSYPLLALLISLLVGSWTIGLCQPSTDMQDFPSSRSGYGLTVYDVTGDGKKDLVTSHYEDGGELWRNDYASGVFAATAIQDLASGRECKFGNMVPGDPWYLAMASSYNVDQLFLYESDPANDELDFVEDYSSDMDYVSWGRANNNQWLDLVATDYDLSQYVRIFLGNADGTLDYSTSFDCGSNRDPDHIALAPMGEAGQDMTSELIIQDG